jgi:hypothetical protein
MKCYNIKILQFELIQKVCFVSVCDERRRVGIYIYGPHLDSPQPDVTKHTNRHTG